MSYPAQDQPANRAHNRPGRPRLDSVALSPDQLGLWFQYCLTPSSLAFQDTSVLAIEGLVDVGRLKDALTKLVDENPELCTKIQVQHGIPSLVSASMPIELQIVKKYHGRTSALWPPEKLDDIPSILDSVQVPFALEADPLVRCCLFVESSSRHVLAVTVHRLLRYLATSDLIAEWLLATYHDMASAAVSNSGASALCCAKPPEFENASSTPADETRTEASLKFWLDELGSPTPLDLPTDRLRPLASHDGTGLSSISVAEDVIRRLRALALKSAVPPALVFAVAYGVTLYRFAGQDDMVIGLAMGDGALAAGTWSIVPIRLKLNDGAITLTDAFELACDSYRRALAHPVAFDQLVAHLNPERNAARNPIYQTIVSVSYPRPLPPARNLGLHRVRLPISLTPGIDLQLMFTPGASPGPDMLQLAFDHEILEQTTVDVILQSFKQVLTELCTNQEATVGSVLLQDRSSLDALVSNWTRHQELDHIARPTLHSLVERQVRRTPDAIALHWRGQEMTYSELDTIANELACRLRYAGAHRDVVVAVCLSRTPALVISLLAVLKSGAAYLGLDPDHPTDRLSFLLEDSGASLLVTEPRLNVLFEDFSGPVVLPEAAAQAVGAETDLCGSEDTFGDDLAYIVYTSGSTGRPKGVAVEHRNVVNLVEGRAQIYGPDQFEVVLASSSISYDSTVSELFVALTTGGTVVLVDNLLELIDAPLTKPVAMIETVPSIMRVLLKYSAVPDSVRTICLSGERLPADLVDEIYRHTRVERVYNTYGPTETTVSTARSLIPIGCTRPPIGRAQPGTRTYVLDDQMQPVPSGMRGELYIGGVGVARGYVNRRDLTDQCFVPDPFVRQGSARMYRTGDFVRELRSGDLEWLGRRDRQIKIRGQRIELGEIEHVLTTTPGVHNGAVVVQAHNNGPRLRAFVEADAEVSRDEIRSFLLARLPIHMVPTTITLMRSLPLTAGGKLDQMALPQPEDEEPAGRHSLTSIENSVVSIWQRYVGAIPMSPADNFFRLGGTSLDALRLVDEVRRAFGVPIDLAHFYGASTLADFCRVLERNLRKHLAP